MLKLRCYAAYTTMPDQRYLPIDISRTALEETAVALLRDHPRLGRAVAGVEGRAAGADRRPGIVVELAEGEAIVTEPSYKYGPGEIEKLASAANFSVAGQWFDQSRRFSVNLFKPMAK